jgi:hypothetical protein
VIKNWHEVQGKLHEDDARARVLGTRWYWDLCWPCTKACVGLSTSHSTAKVKQKCPPGLRERFIEVLIRKMWGTIIHRLSARAIDVLPPGVNATLWLI